MDGQNIETVHNQSSSIRQPQALTIDYDNQILYWSDGSLGKILWSKVEPESEIKNYSSSVFRLKGLVITGRYLFFTDHSGVHIHSVNGTENNVLFYRYSDYYYYYYYDDQICNADFYGIDVISEQRQAQSKQMYTYIRVTLHFLPLFPHSQDQTPVKAILEDVVLWNYVCSAQSIPGDIHVWRVWRHKQFLLLVCLKIRMLML